MNYLITGGCGFIGTNLVSRLLHNNSYIRVIDNLQSGRKSMLSSVCNFTEPDDIYTYKGEVHLFVEDIKNPIVAMRMCEDIDVVIHLAANTGVPISVRYPFEDCKTNIVGTLNYLEAARWNMVKRFIFASTSASSGDYEPPFHEKLFPRPISPYGVSKTTGESYCHVYNKIYNLPTVSLRFSNVYGPNSINKEVQLIPNFIMNAKKGNVLKIFGDGTQTRDYCYVDDLIDAIITSIRKPWDVVGGHVIQIATNIETSVQEITNIILRELRKFEINDVRVEYTDERPGDLQRNYSDVSKAKEMLDWEGKISINDGIKKTVRWFLENM